MICRYIALFVAGLRSAEEFYREVFEMELLFREGRIGGDWGTLPPDKNWDDAERAGVELGMLALRRANFVLALFEGSPAPGTVLEIGIGIDRAECEAVRRRLPNSVTVRDHEEGFLQFDDPFGHRWTLQPPAIPFESNAAINGRWLPV